MKSSYADSQLDAIGCLPMILPFILLSASAKEEQAVGDAHFNSLKRRFMVSLSDSRTHKVKLP